MCVCLHSTYNIYNAYENIYKLENFMNMLLLYNVLF